MSEVRGTKYHLTKGKDITEIAKMVRADLKEAYPSYKFSVKCERFAGGQALHIGIQNTGFKMFTPESDKLEREVRDLVYAYRRDDSDPMIDYHSTNFYANDVRVKS